MASLTQHLDALLLALASSTDNFAVGVSVGIGHNKKPLPVWANAVISVCNATGAWMASFGGVLLSQSMPLVAPRLAALAFGVLALQELWSYRNGSNGNGNERHKLLQVSQVIRLAIPMTLNNVAGGVAAGAAGLSPGVSGMYALVASFGTMAMGHWVGRRLGHVTKVDPSLVSGCLLGVLCLLTLLDTTTVLDE
jgi:putative Mn2+ efflux pump MntP